MSEQKINKSGISLGGLIFVVFLTLKLAGIGQVANWSWWWVTSPLWIGLAIVLAILIGVVVIGLLGLTIMNTGKMIKEFSKIESLGYLNVNSIPTSKLVLDGKVLGDTPKLKLKLKPGVHNVILINSDGVKFEKNIIVIARETTSVSHKF